MASPLLSCAVWIWLLAAPSPGADILAARIAGEVARLDGQRVTLVPDGYVIDDIAGEGKPVVGIVERQGSALFLITPDGEAYRLAGVLARPRIAGPGYKIWALGQITGQSPHRILTARRLGILAPPDQLARGGRQRMAR